MCTPAAGTHLYENRCSHSSLPRLYASLCTYWGCTSGLGLHSKSVLSSCLYLSLITEYRDGAQGNTRVLSGICLPIPQRPGLREGLWQRAKRERPVNSGDSVGIPGVTSLPYQGPQGSQGISQEHSSQEVGTGRGSTPIPNFCWSLTGSLGVYTVCVVGLDDRGWGYRRER